MTAVEMQSEMVLENKVLFWETTERLSSLNSHVLHRYVPAYDVISICKLLKDRETKHIMLQYGWWTCPTERRKKRINDEGQNLMNGVAQPEVCLGAV